MTCTHGSYAFDPIRFAHGKVHIDRAGSLELYDCAVESKRIGKMKDQKDKMGFEDIPATHRGYIAEYALSGMLGLDDWTPKYGSKSVDGPDLMGTLEVKAIEDPRHSLILKPNDIKLRCDYALLLVERTDDDDDPFLVTLQGWVDWTTVEQYGIHHGDGGYRDRFTDRTWVRQDSGATFRTDCYRCARA